MAEAFTVEIFDDIPKWIVGRRDGIGGSDAAAIWADTGVDAWSSPRALYESKVNGIEPDIDPELAEMGHLMEPVIAELYSRRTRNRVIDPGANVIYRSTQFPFMTASLDRIINTKQPGALECKNRGGAWATQEWEDGAPLDVQLQVQHTLAVTGWTWAVIGVLLAGNRPRFIEVARDDEMIALHVERCRVFWETHVLARKPPAPCGHDATGKALRKRYGATKSGKTVTLPPIGIGAHYRLREALATIAAAQDEKKRAENELIELMGDAETAKLPGGLGEYYRCNVKASTYTATRAAYSYPKYREGK